ncbi:MAG: hypothetical protein LBT22_08840, partial [Peptococcaceae bacterium]|nr:hypothetical protein [Peptococcaceae bacterium]
MKRQGINDSAFPKETWSAERVKELTMNKLHNDPRQTAEYPHAPRRLRRRLAMVAAAALLTLTVATAALAVSGALDVGAFYNSIFNNSAAAPYIRTGNGITVQANSGEVTIEPLAGLLDPIRHGVYLQLRLQDPTGAKLPDSASLCFVNNGSILETSDISVTVEDANTIVVSMFVYLLDVIDDEFKVRFDTIASDFRIFEEDQPTGFNIGEHIGMTESVRVPGAEFAEITGITLDGGKLTIAHLITDAPVYGWGFVSIEVQKPDGEIILPSRATGHWGVAGQADEFEIGALDPRDLILVWQGSRAANIITGDWEFTVSGENPLHPRAIEGTFEGHFAQAVLGATSVEIRVHADYYHNRFPYDYEADGAVKILLADGTVVQPKLGGAGMDETAASFYY